MFLLPTCVRTTGALQVAAALLVGYKLTSTPPPITTTTTMLALEQEREEARRRERRWTARDSSWLSPFPSPARSCVSLYPSVSVPCPHPHHVYTFIFVSVLSIGTPLPTLHRTLPSNHSSLFASTSPPNSSKSSSTDRWRESPHSSARETLFGFLDDTFAAHGAARIPTGAHPAEFCSGRRWISHGATRVCACAAGRRTRAIVLLTDPPY